MEGTKPNAGTMAPGTLLLGDRFKILSLLGGGGMGEVYVAEQLSLGRKVALKVLRSEMGSVHGMSDRFRREALLLSSVDHPSVVRIIDFGDSNGAACLVMDLVEGETLEAVLRNGPMPAARGLVVLRQLAEGLAAVHARGIVHRDLKPQNVMICPSPSGEQARLLDFGIARLTEGEGPTGGVTQAGIVIGTPEYLSPEQAVAGKFDDRSDLYSLGVLAYHLLSLKLPLPGPSAREYIIQHATRPATPLLEVAPQLAAHPALVALVMQCLEKRPEDRPRSAAALAQALTAAAMPSSPNLMQVTPSMLVGSPSVSQAPGQTSPDRPSELVPQHAPPPVPSQAMPRPDVGLPPSHTATGAAQGLESTRLSQPGLAPAPPNRDFLPTAPAAPLVTAPLSSAVKRGGLGLIIALAAGGLIFALTRGGATAEVKALVDDGQPEEALRKLDQIRSKEHKLTPAQTILRGQALHALTRHEDEWEAYGKLGNSELDGIEGAAFAGLMEDYGKGSNDQPLIALLDRAPRELYNKRAGAIAKTKQGPAAWGALRFWDKTGASKGDLVDPYIAALDTEDCELKGKAAKRLGELGDSDAIAPLEALAESERHRVAGIFLTNCGHDEAAAAAARLKKKK